MFDFMFKLCLSCMLPHWCPPQEKASSYASGISQLSCSKKRYTRSQARTRRPALPLPPRWHRLIHKTEAQVISSTVTSAFMTLRRTSGQCAAVCPNGHKRLLEAIGRSKLSFPFAHCAAPRPATSCNTTGEFIVTLLCNSAGRPGRVTLL